MRMTAVFAILAGLYASLPARAETSSITDAFVAATTSAYALLQRSDALASAEADSSRLRAFAHQDETRAAAAAEALLSWSQAEQRANRAAAQTPTIDGLGPLLYPFDAVVLPLDVHGFRTSEVDRATIAQLGALRGTNFDALYISTHAVALHRLAESYTDYIKNGDDPALRLLSVRNLPVVRRLLVDIRSL